MHRPTKPYIPRAPRNHGLFGTKFVKNHMFLTNQWPATSITSQYKCMVDLLGKHLEFNKYEKVAERKKQKKAVRKLKTECRDGRTKLKQALYGDSQRIKNLLQNHREMQRLYMMMPSHMVVENINQRTFVKRKERDRLRYRRDQLTKKYEKSMLEISKLEDHIKYHGAFILPEETEIKKCRRDLTNSLTRLQAIRTITRAYNKIIHTLRQDAIYYEPVLDSLQDDIEEQSDFIMQVINLGLPAMGRLKKLSDEYKRIEELTRRRLQSKMASLASYKRRMKQEEEDIKNVVRRADDFEIEPERYNRETESMLDLKSQLEDVEKVIKQVKIATLCSRGKYVYPTMKKQVEDNNRLEKELSIQKKQRDLLNDKEDRAEAMKDLLKHNLTDEEIERLNMIEEMRDSIVAQRKMQSEMDEHVKQRGEIFLNLRWSVMQIIDVLRHIGKPVQGVFRVYPDPDLKLPLLRFEMRTAKCYPPNPTEVNIEKLLQICTTKITELMAAYKEERSEEELNLAKDEYHRAYMTSLIKDDELSDKESDRGPLLETVFSDRADPNVPNRKQIKSISAKIVEEFSKDED